MKKSVIISVIVALGMSLTGCGGGGSLGNSGVGNGTDPLPDVYGYEYIDILNNVDSSNDTINNIRDTWRNANGYKVATVNRDVHCIDYQYREGDKIADNIVNGIRMQQYVIGNTICVETDYQNGPAPVNGSDTIVVGIE